MQNRNLNLISDFVISENVIRTPELLHKKPGVRCIRNIVCNIKNRVILAFFNNTTQEKWSSAPHLPYQQMGQTWWSDNKRIITGHEGWGANRLDVWTIIRRWGRKTESIRIPECQIIKTIMTKHLCIMLRICGKDGGGTSAHKNNQTDIIAG